MFCYYRLFVFGLGRRPMPSGDLSISGSQSPRNPYIASFQDRPLTHYVKNPKNARLLFFLHLPSIFPPVLPITPGHPVKKKQMKVGCENTECIKLETRKHHAEPLILRRHPNRTTVPTCMPKGYQNTSRLRNDKPKEKFDSQRTSLHQIVG